MQGGVGRPADQGDRGGACPPGIGATTPVRTPATGYGMTTQRVRRSEIGPERHCRGCREWWPDDAEFWYVQPKGTSVCRACQQVSHRLARLRKVAAKRPPVVRVRCQACPVEIPDDGRKLCHFDRRTLELAG